MQASESFTKAVSKRKSHVALYTLAHILLLCVKAIGPSDYANCICTRIDRCAEQQSRYDMRSASKHRRVYEKYIYKNTYGEFMATETTAERHEYKTKTGCSLFATEKLRDSYRSKSTRSARVDKNYSMKMMEPVQVATYLLPAVKIGCEMDVDVESSEQQSLSSASNADDGRCNMSVPKINADVNDNDQPACETTTKLPNSVFRESAPNKARHLQLSTPALAPLTATRSFPLSLNVDSSQHNHFSSHLPVASRFSSGSQRKLHRADDDDFDEEIQGLAASMHFENDSSDEVDADGDSDANSTRGRAIDAERRARQSKSPSPASACRKQSDCAVLKRTNNQLAVLAREHAEGKQNARRTASFPIAHSPVEGSSKQCSHHVSNASSLAGIPIEIVPNLFIGDETASFNEQVLRGLNVTHIVNVTKRIPNWHEKCKERPLKYFQIPINDHWSENLLPFLPQVCEFIDSARRENCGAFIHCEAGVSRSATIIVAYVMQTFRLKLDDAYELVRNVKSDICPNFAFMMQLKDFEKQLELNGHDAT